MRYVFDLIRYGALGVAEHEEGARDITIDAVRDVLRMHLETLGPGDRMELGIEALSGDGPGDEERRWIVVGFDFGGQDESISAGCIVFAETPEEAAGKGASWMDETDEAKDGGGAPFEHVFLTEWTDRVAYRVVSREVVMEVAPWQCCGGPSREGRHFGDCPRAEANR